MDDSQKSLKYLISVEKLAEEILSDRRSVVQLDKRRNENREAMRAIKNISKIENRTKKCWITIGSNLFKISTEKSLEMIDKDQKQLDIDINKLRSDLKVKVNQFRDLEHQPPVPGLMLVPLSLEESNITKSLSAF